MKYKGQLKGFPKEVVKKMLERQVDQGRVRDVSAFEKYIEANSSGFNWSESMEGGEFWKKVIKEKNFDLFFQKYPKEEKIDPRIEVVIDSKDRYNSFIKINYPIPEGYEIDEANSTYREIKFKKKERVLPKSWDEYCEFAGLKSINLVEYKSLDSGISCDGLSMKKYTALRKLELLRDYYNDGWVPDYEDDNEKFQIIKYHNTIDNRVNISYHRILTFKDIKLLEEFTNNFKGLIEEAGDLI